jgi:hypothetical protein
MTFTDAAVILLALQALIHALLLVSLRRRLTRVEQQVRFHCARLSKLERDLDTVWVSPNHQLPKLDLKPDRGLKQ